MTEPALGRLERVLRKTFPNMVDYQPVSELTTSREVPGWDSLSHAVFIMAMEDEFSTQLPLEETLDAVNLGDLLAILRRSGAS